MCSNSDSASAESYVIRPPLASVGNYAGRPIRSTDAPIRGRPRFNDGCSPNLSPSRLPFPDPCLIDHLTQHLPLLLELADGLVERGYLLLHHQTPSRTIVAPLRVCHLRR